MSFSQEVKEEVLNKYTKATHCQKAQLAALLIFDGKNVNKDREKEVFVLTFMPCRNIIVSIEVNKKKGNYCGSN